MYTCMYHKLITLKTASLVKYDTIQIRDTFLEHKHDISFVKHTSLTAIETGHIILTSSRREVVTLNQLTQKFQYTS